jgi:pimeloyl-ACP methyl ester carboxylesterase
MSPEQTSPSDIVLIHGLWMTPRSWEHWKERYESRGHKVHAPAWPGMEASVEELNENPEPIAELDLDEVVDHYAGVIGACECPPIIIGHSFGGAFMQILLDRGLGAVGVGVSSSTVKGVPDLPLSTLRSTAPVLGNPFGAHKAVPLNEKQFHYAFANTLSREESDQIYRRHHVPAAKAVLREGAFANLHRHPPTEVDFAKEDRAPMLFIGFGEDHIIPAKVTRHNAEKYESGLVTFKEFEGRPHFPGAPGWEEVADFALDWAREHVGAVVATSSG